MEYLNQFHKESTERCLKQIEEWDKSPKPSEEAAKQAKVKVFTFRVPHLHPHIK